MKQLLSYHCEPALKSAVLARVARHQRLDEIVQRTYWKGGRGCLIGCSLHSGDHSAFETHLGLPRWLAHLSESIFEGLPKEEAVNFPFQLLNAIPTGSDLSNAWHDFAAWMILDPEHGVSRFNADPAIIRVGEMHRDHVSGQREWSAARYAAMSEAGSAAGSEAGYEARIAQRDKLLEIVKAAPVPSGVEPSIPNAEILSSYKADLKEYAL